MKFKKKKKIEIFWIFFIKFCELFFSKENFFLIKNFKFFFFFKVLELFIYLIFFHGTEAWGKVLLKVLFFEKKFTKFQTWKKQFFLNFFQRIYSWKNFTSLNFGKIFNFFAKVQEATKIYKNVIVIQYPFHWVLRHQKTRF